MRTFLPIFAAAPLLIFISACAAVQPTMDTPEHNAHGDAATIASIPFDANFIDSMLEHHQGAIDMAEMALEQAEHEEIRTLAQEIIVAQTSEIEQMQSWRNEWFAGLET